MAEALSPPAERTARATLAADLIIANAPDPVFVCDLEGKILEANDAVSRLLGLRRDEVLEQSISRFLGQDEPDQRVLVSVIHARFLHPVLAEPATALRRFPARLHRPPLRGR